MVDDPELAEIWASLEPFDRHRCYLVAHLLNAGRDDLAPAVESLELMHRGEIVEAGPDDLIEAAGSRLSREEGIQWGCLCYLAADAGDPATFGALVGLLRKRVAQ